MESYNQLCVHCMAHQVEVLIREFRPRDLKELTKDIVWQFSVLIGETGCPFCRVVRHCIIGASNTGLEDLINNHSAYSTELQVKATWQFPEFAIGIQSGNQFRTSAYSVQFCEDLPHRNTIPEFRSHQINSWLERCDKEHDVCRGSVNRTPLPLAGFRLIDVERGCIVPGSINWSYCALSYVWGSAKQYMLLKSNIAQLETERSLFTVKHLLPKTISDAMELCQKTGLRYLWVDALCIIQDDNISKLSQIERMGDVYQASSLTFVATSGDDADAGLPPFNTSRQVPIYS